MNKQMMSMEELEQVNGGNWLWDVDEWLRKHSETYKKWAEEWDEQWDEDDE